MPIRISSGSSPSRIGVGLALAAILGLLLSARIAHDAWAAAASAIQAESDSLLLGLRHLDIPFLRREIESRAARHPELLLAAVIAPGARERLVGPPPGQVDMARLRRLEPGTSRLLLLPRGPALVHAVDISASLPRDEIDIRDVELYVGRWLPTPAETTAIWSLALGWLAFGAVAGVLVWHQRRYQRRLAAINRHLTRVGTGRLDLLEDEPGAAPEILALTRNVNRMIVGLRTRISVLRSLAEISAHELRTRLTRLQLGLARLDRAARDERLRQDARLLRDDLNDLIALHDGLVSLAQTTADLHDLSQFQTFDLAALLRDLVEDYADELSLNGRRLTIVLNGPVMVQGEIRLVRRLFENLLDNACKHAPPGACVTVSLSIERNAFTAMVANTETFPADIRDRAFEAGARSRQAAPGGLGLGLTLVRAVAEKHGWRVAIMPSAEIAAVEVYGMAVAETRPGRRSRGRQEASQTRESGTDLSRPATGGKNAGPAE